MACTAAVLGEYNFIRQWNANVPPDKYEIDQDARRVTIKAGSFYVFKFEAFDLDTDFPYDPGVIKEIVIDQDGAGLVQVAVIGDPSTGREYGARDVKKLDLTRAFPGYIVRFKIAGDLGQSAATVADHIAESGGLPPLFSVGGNVLSEVFVDDCSADVTIGGNCTAMLSLGNLTGDVAINGDGPHAGAISLSSSYGGAISVNGTLNGNITVNGALNGSITIHGSLAGSAGITGDFNGLLTVDDNVSGSVSTTGDLRGSVWVKGAIPTGGSISVTGDILDNGDNYVAIKYMTGGAFSCRDMNLNDLTQPWSKGLQIGWGVPEGDYWQTTHTGSITVNGVLRGALFIGGCSALALDVGSMAGTNPEPRVHATYKYLDECSILVRGDVSNGRIRIGDRAGEFGSEPGMAGTITIEGSLASAAQIDTLNPLTPGGQVPAPITADITVDGDLAGQIHSSGDLSGLVNAVQDLSGEVHVEGDMTGAVHCGADVSGAVLVDGVLWDTAEHLSGGHIAVNGSLTSTGYIEAQQGYYGSTEFVTIDYDGWDDGDDWESGGIVQIGPDPQELQENDPATRRWHVTCLRGDLSNDGQVSAFDIDPFVLALASADAYALAWPGLGSSMQFHADLNCDGSVNAFDIDPFVLRLTDPEEYACAHPYCDPCLPECPNNKSSGQSPGDEPLDDVSSPAAVAALLRDNVAPERLSFVIEIAAELASAYADTPRGEFWAAVLAALE
jgi:hypothetical protein